ncbi:hypothetical protein CSKR_203486 [Clonorchis sinensis]|uniref:Uncharacterized protein n=1 Tax=Clonorchis sinensis TaxID=79923 RepID=A0A8T1MBY1_CLOSI|nr:hypothetical protein CSKR_203486 [Clonorchis sinensis]
MPHQLSRNRNFHHILRLANVYMHYLCIASAVAAAADEDHDDVDDDEDEEEEEDEDDENVLGEEIYGMWFAGNRVSFSP